MSTTRVTIQWTDTARESLRVLPLKVRQGIIAKIDELDEGDPRKKHKPLIGPLKGCYSIKYSRYRAIYRIEEENIANGDVLIHIHIQVIATGIRKENDRNDVYQLAKKMVEMGLLNSPISPLSSFTSDEDND